jgi:hypothetical protein
MEITSITLLIFAYPYASVCSLNTSISYSICKSHSAFTHHLMSCLGKKKFLRLILYGTKGQGAGGVRHFVILKMWQGSVSKVTGYGMGNQDSIPAESKNYFLDHRVLTGSGTHTNFCSTGTGNYLHRLKRQEHEAYRSHPSSMKIKNSWSCTCTPAYVFMAWCSKNMDSFYAENVIERKSKSRWWWGLCALIRVAPPCRWGGGGRISMYPCEHVNDGEEYQ